LLVLSDFVPSILLRGCPVSNLKKLHRLALSARSVVIILLVAPLFSPNHLIMRLLKLTICLCIAACCCTATHAQGFLKKIKEKAENAANKVVDKKVDESINKETGNTSGGDNNSPNGASKTPKYGKPSNKGGQGLVSAPPDVKENLTASETAFKGSNYGESRYALQQAILGVELQIGQNLLKSLPNNIGGLNKDSMQDQVTSTGWGWAGLTIQRVYHNKDDKQFTLTIANNSLWMQAINMYLANGGYQQTTNGQQNWKQVKVKGHRAVIEYNESSGYKLSIPLGQTSLIICEGINFATEQEMMNAANQVDIDGIKKSLGEK
jgi:hypothetical protein